MDFYGIEPVTLVDFPGKIAFTLFTKGCDLRCPICHNPKLVLPELGKDLEGFPVKRAIEHIKESRGWLEAVCITGGEPLIHAGLPKVLRQLKSETGIEIKIDTNGAHPQELQDLYDEGLIDFVALDVKAPLGTAYQHITGGHDISDLVGRSIFDIQHRDLPHQFRTVCVPGIHRPEDIGEIAKLLSVGAKSVDYVLAPFKPNVTLAPEMGKVPAPTEKEMSAYLEAAREFVRGARWR
jgi:pyruvate formate lyase activating enzyme